MAWSLIGAMTDAFRAAEPHEGYAVITEALFRTAPTPRAFVVTSNIDGYFSRAGVPEEFLFEAHGCVEFLQCTSVGTDTPCEFAETVWPAGSGSSAPLTRESLPRCLCGAPARPNVSHTTDSDADVCGARKQPQRARLLEWLSAERRSASKLVVLELGCGTSAHALRLDSELACARQAGAGTGASARLVRVDPGDATAVPGSSLVPAVALKLGALPALKALFSGRKGLEGEALRVPSGI